MKKRYADQAARVRARGLRPGRRLTFHGQFALHPRFVPRSGWKGHEGEIVYYADDTHSRYGFWTLPLVANVQFPWRALAIAEFAFVTGFASGAIAPVRLALAALPALTFATLFLKPYAPPDLLSPSEILARHHDVPEYLPAGVPSSQYWYSRWALDLAARQPPLAVHDGVTTMRRFDFLAWQVRCGGRIVPHHPDSETRLLSWRGEGCAVSRVLTAPERAGYFISVLVLVAFAAQFVIRGRHRG